MVAVLTFFFLLIASCAFAIQSIVILPFSNKSEKQEIYWLGEGFAESLSEEMLLQNAYIIQRVERKSAYDELRLPYTGDLSRATMLKIGERLSADYVVFGSYNLKGTELSVEVRVIAISSAKLSEPIRASGTLNHLYEVQTAIREGLKKYFVSVKFFPVEQRPLENQRVTLHAYELYIKGLLEVSDAERVKFFQRAIQANPSYPRAIYRLGLALYRLQRYRESNEFLNRIRTDGVFQAKADFVVGLNLYLMLDFEAARAKWMQLLETHPTGEVNNNIAAALMRKGDFDNSEWYLIEAIKLDPSNENFRFNLAALYVQKKLDEKAVRHYREAIQVRPDDYQSHYLLAKLLEKTGNPGAKKLMDFFHDTLPPDQRGKFPEQYSSFIQLLRPAAIFYSKEEKEYFSSSKAKFANQRVVYSQSYQANARRYLQQQEPEKAVLEIRKGVGLTPLDWLLHYLWGHALLVQRNHVSAAEELQFSLWCRENAESHALLAEIYADWERYADAKMQIRLCLALDAKNKKAMEVWNKIWNKQ